MKISIISKIRKITKTQIIIIAILIIIAVSYAYLKKPNESPYEFIIVSRTNLIDEINVTGRVKPNQNIELAFEKVGKISAVYAKVSDDVYKGQLLASLSNADLIAQLNQAKASLEAEEIKLNELKKGTRTEEIKISESKLESAKITIDDAKNGLINKIEDAYTKSDDAIRNKIDQFINNPTSPNPELIFQTDIQLKNDIEDERHLIGNMLNSWKNSIELITKEGLDQHTENSKDNLNQINSFLNKVATAVNNLNPSSTLSQTTIDSYKSDTSTARTNINTAKTNILSAEEKLRTAESNLLIAENELLLKKAGATKDEILAQEAKIKSAQANIESIEAQIAKTIIISPINGIVTKQDFKVGEIISANAPGISLISKEKFKIEANIPEADIPRIKIGNKAKVTLDAYGDDEIFDSEVVAIDPAETIIEGVATYKTTLEFLNGNGRIKSGMTANIDILSSQKNNALAVPTRAINEKDDKKIVQLLITDGKTESLKEVEVKTGLRSSSGLIEIIDGLNEGDKVVTFINK